MNWWTTTKMILTMRCEQSARLLSRQQDVPLPRGERAALLMHLLVCKACRRYRRQLAMLRRTFARLRDPGGGPAESRLSPAARDKIVQVLRDAAGPKD